MKKNPTSYLILAISTLAAFSACAPKIYVNDRHTVMEDEAAGEWPDFEKETLSSSMEAGPVPFAKTEINSKKKRLYNVLNGELTAEVASSKKSK